MPSSNHDIYRAGTHLLTCCQVSLFVCSLQAMLAGVMSCSFGEIAGRRLVCIITGAKFVPCANPHSCRALTEKQHLRTGTKQGGGKKTFIS